ncbi:MAG TPA: DUF5343 domain-containing protein [Acidimicrobiales bacterium]|jgi:hypothetical protein
MKLLGFIDSEGTSTPEFDTANRAPEAEYKERLGELITEAYGEVITFADPATDSYDRVRDAFRPFNPRGQQERMVTLFLGLLEYVGLDIAAAAGSRRRIPNGEPGPAKRNRPSTTTPRNKNAAPRSGGGNRGQGIGRSFPSGRDAALVAWFDSRPDVDTPWATDDRDRFMTTLRAIIDGVYQEPSVADEEDS